MGFNIAESQLREIKYERTKAQMYLGKYSDVIQMMEQFDDDGERYRTLIEEAKDALSDN